MPTHTNSALIEALKDCAVVGLIEVGDDHPDALIVKAWNKRQEALAEIEGRCRFFDAQDSELETFDALENGIPEMTAATPLGLLPKLWIALCHTGGKVIHEWQRVQSDSLRRGDFNEVASFIHELDFEQQVIFGVIRDILNAQRFEAVAPQPYGSLVPPRKAA